MRSRFAAGAACLWLSLCLSPLGATVLPRGEIFRLDAQPECQEHDPDIAALTNGRRVVVWAGGPLEDFSSTGRIYARIFDSEGSPLAPPFQVSSTGSQVEPAVAAAADGKFLVVWRERPSDRIFARLFDSSGTPLGGPTAVTGTSGSSEPDVAALPDGRFAVVWNDSSFLVLGILDANGQDTDEGTTVVGYISFTGVSPFVVDPAVTVQPDGDLVVVWGVQNVGFEFSSVDGRIIPVDALEDPDEWRKLEIADPIQGWVSETAVGTDGGGNIVMAWKAQTRDGGLPTGITAQILDPEGRFVRHAFQAVGGTWSRLGGPALLVAPSGDFVLAWAGLRGEVPGPGVSSIYAQTFDAAGVAQGEMVELAGAEGHGREQVALAWGDDGEAVAVWQEGPEPASCPLSGIAGRNLSPGCLAGPGRLCLGNGRFQLETTWVAPFGAGTGQGQAVALTRDSGYFWFFGADNVELMVKVLDGRAVNDHFWVFYGSLSNVAWRLRVTDLATGRVKNYDNPASQLASRGDTDAFPAPAVSSSEDVEVRAFDDLSLDREAFPAGPSSPEDLPAPDLRPAAAASHRPGEGGYPGPCTELVPVLPLPTRPGLCLNAERFEVEVTWHDFQGHSGVGQGVPLTEDSGYFWFFDPANVELVVKVLDGREVNGKFWVFYGALTNVRYDILVHHPDTGAQRLYQNLPFQFRSVADTNAFTVGIVIP